MNIANLHWNVKDRVNKLDSNHYQDMKPIQLDAAINNAAYMYKQHFAYANRLPFEVNQARLDMLSTLVVKNPDQPAIVPTLVNTVPFRQYEIKTSGFKYEYANLIRMYAICGNSTISVSFVKHDELSDVLDDEFRNPSQKWNRIVGTIGKTSDDNTKTSIYLYSEQALTEVYPEYIRRHKPVFFGNYNSVEYLDCQRRELNNCSQFYNESSSPVDLDLPDQYFDLLVDIACYIITGKTENPQLINIFKDKLNFQTN